MDLPEVVIMLASSHMCIACEGSRILATRVILNGVSVMCLGVGFMGEARAYMMSGLPQGDEAVGASPHFQLCRWHAVLSALASSRASLFQLGRTDVSVVVSSDDPNEARRVTQICHTLATVRGRLRMHALLALALPVGAPTEEQPAESSAASSAIGPATAMASGSPAAAHRVGRPPSPWKDEAALRVPPGGDRVPNWRIDRAQKLGESAGQKLRGEISTMPTSPEPTDPMPAPRFYCVLCSSDGSRPAIYRSGKMAKDHVIDPQEPSGLGAAAVFHDFPSMAEVKAYCNAARVAVPEDASRRGVSAA